MENEDFEPDFNADISIRLELFKDELTEAENTLYITNNDRLFEHYYLSIHHVAGNVTAAFGFKEGSDLDYKTKMRLFKIFFKHFPDGVQIGLKGHRGN